MSMNVTNFIEKLQPLLGWLAVISLLTFVTSLILIPVIVGKLQPETFVNLIKKDTNNTNTSLKKYFVYVLTNLIAILLLFSGFIMLFIPGQGLLTILVGLLLLSFPGKQKIVCLLIRRQGLQKSLNWIRAKQHKAPFTWPD